MTAHPAATVVVTAVAATVVEEAVMTENDDVKMDVSIEWFDPTKH